MRADNFKKADLPKLIEFLHRHGVKGFVAFNTLIFPESWRELWSKSRSWRRPEWMR